MFKWVPDAHIAWRDARVGGAFTALLFTLGKILIGLYLTRSDPGSAFGAAGALAVILVWIYYSAMILLFGAEFTETWATERGAGVEPRPGAVRTARRGPGPARRRAA
jgi:membrane protein